jgi:hypothetical protein
MLFAALEDELFMTETAQYWNSVTQQVIRGPLLVLAPKYNVPR